MTVLTASSSTLVAAHTIHYAVLVAGLAGLVYLLAPGLVRARRGGPEPAPRDEHEARVRMLRADLADGGAGSRPSPAVARVARDRIVTVAVAASLVAAVIHAAVCPEHFRERFAFGVFFAVSALAQVLWAFAVLRAPSVSLWVAGAVGNFLVVALWTVTRVEGLPLGLLPEPEAVGVWDVLASIAEMVVVVAAVVAARRGAAPAPSHRKLTGARA